jgi:hypothetical protein
LDITLNTYPNYTEPIDSLQERFDLWGGCTSSSVPLYTKNKLMIFPNPVDRICTIRHPGESIQKIELFNSMGRMEHIEVIPDINNASYGLTIDTSHLSPGIYFLRATVESGKAYTSKILKL